MTHESRMECVVIGIPDERRGSLVKALVVLKEGFSADELLAKELRNSVKKRLDPLNIPVHWSL